MTLSFTSNVSSNTESVYWEKVKKVAESLAVLDAQEYKKMCNTCSELSSFEDCSSENNLTTEQYYDMLVYGFSEQYFKILSNMKKDTVNVLIAWNDYNPNF